MFSLNATSFFPAYVYERMAVLDEWEIPMSPELLRFVQEVWDEEFFEFLKKIAEDHANQQEWADYCDGIAAEELKKELKLLEDEPELNELMLDKVRNNRQPVACKFGKKCRFLKQGTCKFAH